MKKILLTIGFVLGTILKLQSQGYIIPNGVTPFGTYGFHVLQNPTNNNITGFWLRPQGKTPPGSPYVNTYLYEYFLDESVRVFLVSANDPISQQAILSGHYAELTYPNTYIFEHGLEFYLGLYTGETYPQNGIYNDALFGWARLVNNQGAIQMLDSALAYRSQGIFAGTQNLIPEPSAFSLIALGLGLIGLCCQHSWRTR